jgi:hypothetical protein
MLQNSASKRFTMSVTGVWKVLQSIVKYGAYIIIFIECVALFMTKVEDKENKGN